MDPARFCSQTGLVIVAGKGGVGKTTVTAALAVMAARSGLSTLIVEVEGKSGLGALDVISTAVPGIKDILILGKVKQLERSGQADLIVLDAPAAGHAVTFLTSARGLLDAVRVGPVRAQAEDVMELLTDPARCQVLLVTMPEETPVNEAADTAAALRQRVGVRLGAVVVNGVYPRLESLEADPEELAARSGTSLRPGEAEALRAAAEFRARRQELQQEQVARLAAVVDLPQLHLPFVFEADLGPAEMETLADELTAAVTGLERAP